MYPNNEVEYGKITLSNLQYKSIMIASCQVFEIFTLSVYRELFVRHYDLSGQYEYPESLPRRILLNKMDGVTI